MKELLKRKGVRIGLLIIILLVAMGIIGMNTQSVQKRKEYNGHIEAAEKYLSDLDYEQAIAEYTLALQIEPKSEEVLSGLEKAYLAYARSCADTGDYEMAMDILEEGYVVVQRESLAIQIEEYRNLVETDKDGGQQGTGENGSWQGAEAETETESGAGTESAQADDIKQVIENSEIQEKVLKLNFLFASSSQHYITTEQIKELCWPVIEALEQYRALYPENLTYYIYLSRLYYLAGEHELCAQLIEELHERFPDEEIFSSESSTESARCVYDEYGRLVRTEYYDETNTITEVEYGQNGKVKRVVTTDELHTDVQEYEYDSEGRVSKATHTYEGEVLATGGLPGTDYTIPHSSTNVQTYEYSEGGFFVYTDWTLQNDGSYDAGRYVDEYVIDEYGGSEMVGERVTL